MRSDRLYNYFEEFSICNDSLFIIVFVIFSFIIIANTYLITKYIYKKCCKNKIPFYIESKNTLTDDLIICCER